MVDPIGAQPGLILQAEHHGDEQILQAILQAMRHHRVDATAQHGFLEEVRIPVQLLPPQTIFGNLIVDRALPPDTMSYRDGSGRLHTIKLIDEKSDERQHD